MARTELLIFPPGCSRCKSSLIELLPRMRAYHKTEDWFRCDGCGHVFAAPRFTSERPRRIDWDSWPMALAALGTALLTFRFFRRRCHAYGRSQGKHVVRVARESLDRAAVTGAISTKLFRNRTHGLATR